MLMRMDVQEVVYENFPIFLTVSGVPMFGSPLKLTGQRLLRRFSQEAIISGETHAMK